MDTRSLSVASLIIVNSSIETKSSTAGTILYYENPTGQVSALRQDFTDYSLPTWIDVTSQSSKSLPDLRKDLHPMLNNTLYESAPNDTFGPPFTTGVDLRTQFYSPLHDCILETEYYLDVNYSEFQTTRIFDTIIPEITKPNQNNVAIRQSDIAMLNRFSFIWINGTQPAMSPGYPPPDNPFPFTRLASVSSADGSSIFLYHQINDTTFAEEHWDPWSKAWLAPDYITIPDS